MAYSDCTHVTRHAYPGFALSDIVIIDWRVLIVYQYTLKVVDFLVHVARNKTQANMIALFLTTKGIHIFYQIALQLTVCTYCRLLVLVFSGQCVCIKWRVEICLLQSALFMV